VEELKVEVVVEVEAVEVEVGILHPLSSILRPVSSVLYPASCVLVLYQFCVFRWRKTSAAAVRDDACRQEAGKTAQMYLMQVLQVMFLVLMLTSTAQAEAEILSLQSEVEMELLVPNFV
jgi:hypothetical protein